MDYHQIFLRLWSDYITLNPEVGDVYNAFASYGETIVNDHIAFRTFDHPRLGINKLSRVFTENGYKEMGSYRFEAKKLFAKHFEHQSDPTAPRVFISELIMSEFDLSFQETINQIINQVPEGFEQSDDLLFASSIFQPTSFQTYEQLRKKSEYAAWVYAFGFRANHFTVSVNHLQKLTTLQMVNDFLKTKGFMLNTSGGEIKGHPEELLEQSSTLAGIVNYPFVEGVYPIPACYYEFARRYPDESGKLYSGFIARSADKIFESTDYRATR